MDAFVPIVGLVAATRLPVLANLLELDLDSEESDQ
jgi:hypothetical protein